VTSFGTDGVLTYVADYVFEGVSYPLESSGEALTIDSAGDILVGGYSFVAPYNPDTNIMVWKYNQ